MRTCRGRNDSYKGSFVVPPPDATSVFPVCLLSASDSWSGFSSTGIFSSRRVIARILSASPDRSRREIALRLEGLIKPDGSTMKLLPRIFLLSSGMSAEPSVTFGRSAGLVRICHANSEYLFLASLSSCLMPLIYLFCWSTWRFFSSANWLALTSAAKPPPIPSMKKVAQLLCCSD